MTLEYRPPNWQNRKHLQSKHYLVLLFLFFKEVPSVQLSVLPELEVKCIYIDMHKCLCWNKHREIFTLLTIQTLHTYVWIRQDLFIDWGMGGEGQNIKAYTNNNIVSGKLILQTLLVVTTHLLLRKAVHVPVLQNSQERCHLVPTLISYLSEVLFHLP